MKKTRLLILSILLTFIFSQPKVDSFNDSIVVLNTYNPQVTTIEKLSEEDTSVESLKEVYNRVLKGVVTVTEYIMSYGSLKAYGYGSGFVFKETTSYYYIMTNYHVIEKAAGASITTYYGQTEYCDIVGGDETQDVAILKIKKSALKYSLYVQELDVDDNGLYSYPEVGDTIFAIGNPTSSNLTGSLNIGMVEGIKRIVSYNTFFDQSHAIQIGCHINSGNSGGPLFNEEGKVIGVNTLKLASPQGSTVEGLNFALPIHDMMTIGNRILKTENSLFRQSYESYRMGLDSAYISNMMDVKYLERKQHGLLEHNTGVVLLMRSRLLDADAFSVITEIDGHPIEGLVDLRWYLLEKENGYSATFTIYKNKNNELTKETVTVELVTSFM